MSRITQFRSLSDRELLALAEKDVLPNFIGTQRQQDIVVELVQRLAIAGRREPNVGGKGIL